MGNEIWIVVRFWAFLFLFGAVAYPLTRRVFSGWWDRGYLFTKAVGLMSVSYLVWLSASLHFLPFSNSTVTVFMFVVFLLGLGINMLMRKKSASGGKSRQYDQIFSSLLQNITWEKVVRTVILEAFFFAALLSWSYVKGHEPSIHGLEKFMDFGFARSIQDGKYFPPNDMWYAGSGINYYYFGHFVMAMLSEFSGIHLRYAFNLMLATLFAFTFTMSFSIGYQLIISNFRFTPPSLVPEDDRNSNTRSNHKTLVYGSERKKYIFALIAGLLTAYLMSFAGNMQTIYAFTKGYTGENVKPFWELLWSPAEFPQKVSQGMDIYWYANATRFIPYTIHEFPSYSFVVSDVHGHVLSLPFVFLAIAFLLEVFGNIKGSDDRSQNRMNDSRPETASYPVTVNWALALFFGVLAAVLFMTNVLDAPIYMMLFLVLSALCLTPYIFHFKRWFSDHAANVGFAAFAGPAIIPFVLKFKSFVSGLAVNCPPAFLAEHKIGLFLFETTDKCQKSPLWMMWLLWGFFIFSAGWLILARFDLRLFFFTVRNGIRKHNLMRKVTEYLHQVRYRFSPTETVLVIFFLYSLGLIIFPEFFYFKDIYPQHFRSNTMFKLGYQAYIMFTIISGYAIVKTLISWLDPHREINRLQKIRLKKNTMIFLVLLLPQLFLVGIYPYFSIKSYFGPLGNYRTLDGLEWLAEQYPDDYRGIMWLDNVVLKCRQTKGCSTPVIVEADGDSYTDYDRFSAFSGAPTVVGWAVHEWLWRGSYDVVAPRREDVAKIYEDYDVGMTEKILAKYNVSYIIVGTLEREKYQNLNEAKIAEIGKLAFSSGNTKIYRVNYVSGSGFGL